MGINVIVTGATGMVGEGVVHECLLHPEVSHVLVVGRRPCEIEHPKLREIVHHDFYDLSSMLDELVGYDACFFCLGTTSVGKSKAEYKRQTYDLTMHVGETLAGLDPGMTFVYVSGAGTNERGWQHWARVKGRTERDLSALPFHGSYAFRPGFIQATPGLRRTLPYYRFFAWIYPLVRRLGWACTLPEIGQAMIHAALAGYAKPVLEVRDIVELAAKAPRLGRGGLEPA